MLLMDQVHILPTRLHGRVVTHAVGILFCKNSGLLYQEVESQLKQVLKEVYQVCIGSVWQQLEDWIEDICIFLPKTVRL